MSRPAVTIAPTFSCHAWNKDQSQVALAPNNKLIWVFNTNGNPSEMKGWGKPQHVLDGHSDFVSAIDWHPETNQIVTCGHDRNAYVWVCEDGTWKPTLVILRSNRAATSVRWSPNGKKFAVTTGAKCVPVCNFEKDSNWWISKMIKKHKSTVLCCAWAPNNLFLVTGATDFKCRIFTVMSEETDTVPDGVKWKKADQFGTLMAEFDQAKAWVQGVAWSPCGNTVCFTGHGSSTHFINVNWTKAKDSTVQSVYSKDLPHLTCDFLSSDQLVCSGFDMDPHLYEKSGDEWKFSKKMDPRTAGAQVSSKRVSAMAHFKDMDKRGQSAKTKKASKIETFHENTIIDLKVINEKTFSTCGIDGRILIWNM